MDIVEAIGNTPIVKLKEGIYAKLEYLNPTGSIKDRTAWGMLKNALDKKLISEKGIVEPTSGNTGISLAFLGAYLDIPITIIMPENMSKQRISIMKKFNANVILTKAEGGMRESLGIAKEMSRKGYILLDQFSNPANPLIHEHTTAIEIENQIKKVDIFVCGVGTGGTLTGVAKRLKKTNPNIEVVAVEPKGSPFLSEGRSGVHKIQGLGAGFLPKVLDVRLIDKIITISDEEALTFNDKLVKYEGIFAGISSGAAYCAALKIKYENPNKTILTIFADSMDRYI